MHAVATLVVLFLLALLSGRVAAQYGDEYPMESLQCYSYLTKPDMKLICPASRNKYCVKEVSTLTQDICGATQYFGDMYVNKQCVFKKCNATCTPGLDVLADDALLQTRPVQLGAWSDTWDVAAGGAAP
eukprot:gene12801-16274_t